MARYLLLNLGVMVLVLVVAAIGKLPFRSLLNRKGLWLLGALLVMTAIGDNAIIGLHLVDYNTSHILGVYLGLAPLEDFSYALLAVILVPLLWERGAKK